MKILVFDIGGTSIKYGHCIDNVLVEVKETPTNAHLGGPHILQTIISLVQHQDGYDAIGISTAGTAPAAGVVLRRRLEETLPERLEEILPHI